VSLYRRDWQYTDATVSALAIDAPGYVPWWREEVTLFNILVQVLSDTTRHAGHADILREQLDGTIGMNAQGASLVTDNPERWQTRRPRSSRRPGRRPGQRLTPATRGRPANRRHPRTPNSARVSLEAPHPLERAYRRISRPA
jgi:hypothetical protein